MIYPESAELKLGFDVIRKKLIAYCRSDLGRKEVGGIKFSSSLSTISHLLTEVDELNQLRQEIEVPETGSFNDIEDLVSRSQIKGNWLTSKELLQVKTNISAVCLFTNYILDAGGKYASLENLVVSLSALNMLESRLLLTVDRDGEILSSASDSLKRLRQKINLEERSLRNVVEKLFKKAQTNGYVPEGSSIGIRDGRMVIPVLAGNKKLVQGFIHDESATGNIVFLEPTEVLDKNNSIRELHLAEAREINNILIECTTDIRQLTDELISGNKFLGKIDCLLAKTKLARHLKSVKPQLSESKCKLIDLRHPLLVDQTLKTKREVVSHNINLSDEDRILVVSGPNAGGKSVVLKSVGLNQMMVQSGIFPCCGGASCFRVFEDLLIDIGDEQSIESDLSTYSSHLKNMGIMLSKAGPKALILIDEFGSGTDPAFGGAIAQAVLLHLNKKKCIGVITTHFSNLKLFADKTAGIINAAMVFDLKKLKPKYELEIGHPGSSFSLEVAKASGLPDEVIRLAKKELGAEQIEIEDLLNRLELEKIGLQEKSIKLIERDDELTRITAEYAQLSNEINNTKSKIINDAKATASGILSKTNKEIEKTIRHIKENKAEKKETAKIRHSLSKYSQKIEPQKLNEGTDRILLKGKIKVGDSVHIKNTEVIGEVSELKGKKALLLVGDLQSLVPITELQKVSNPSKEDGRKTKYVGDIAKILNSRLANFSPNLDVRGTIAADILPILQRFLDDAIAVNQSQLKIIHGKGNGVLRQIVHKEIKQWSQVISFEDDHADRGGSGATILHL